MTPENFCYWLQGVFEVSNPQEMNKEQLQVVKDHLSLVFNKITPIKHNIKFDFDKCSEMYDITGKVREIIDKMYKDAETLIINKSEKLCSRPVNGIQLCDVKDYKTGKPIDYPFTFQDGPPRSC